MPSDNPQFQTGYLKGTLISGLTPFLYRSRVRSLLGLPTAGTNKVSAGTTAPPVGFRYQNQAILSGLSEADRFIDASAQKNAVPLISNDRPGFDNLGRKTDQYANSYEYMGDSFQNDSEIGATSNIAKRLEGSSKSLEDAPDERDLSIKNMEIPGISTDKQPVSPRVHPEELIPLQEKKAEQAQHTEFSYGERVPDSAPTGSVSKKDSAKNIEEQHGDRTQSEKSNPSSLLQNNISFNKKDNKGPQPAPKSSISQHRSFNSLTGTSPEASDKIEQLRQTFHEIAKKQYTPAKEQTSGIIQPSSPKTASPPPPSQPVIIYKRMPHRTKARCAFWERSYMSRINIRTLR